jgi:hypothetical protein
MSPKNAIILFVIMPLILLLTTYWITTREPGFLALALVIAALIGVPRI